MIRHVFRIRRKHINSRTDGRFEEIYDYMHTLRTWNSEGKYFKRFELLKVLQEFIDNEGDNEKFPDDWEIIEYHLIETKQITPTTFIRWRAPKPFIKGIL